MGISPDPCTYAYTFTDLQKLVFNTHDPNLKRVKNILSFEFLGVLFNTSFVIASKNLEQGKTNSKGVIEDGLSAKLNFPI